MDFVCLCVRPHSLQQNNNACFLVRTEIHGKHHNIKSFPLTRSLQDLVILVCLLSTGFQIQLIQYTSTTSGLPWGATAVHGEILIPKAVIPGNVDNQEKRTTSRPQAHSRWAGEGKWSGEATWQKQVSVHAPSCLKSKLYTNADFIDLPQHIHCQATLLRASIINRENMKKGSSEEMQHFLGDDVLRHNLLQYTEVEE